MNLFYLAQLELLREGKNHNDLELVLERATTMRKWFDKHGKHAQAIMSGDTVYRYDNNIKTYHRV